MIQYTSADNDKKYTVVKLKTRIQPMWQRLTIRAVSTDAIEYYTELLSYSLANPSISY